MSLYARLAEEKLRALSVYSENSKSVIPDTCLLEFDMTEGTLKIEDRGGMTYTFRNVSAVDSVHYLEGLLITAGRVKPKGKHRVYAKLRIECDCPDRFLYVVVKDGKAYLYDGPYCMKYPEECGG